MTKADIKKFEECTAEAPLYLHEQGVLKPSEQQIDQTAHWLFTRWKGMTDFYYFCAKIMDMESAKDSRTGRKRWDPVMHRRMCMELQRDEDTMQLYPRLHMKSTLIKMYCLWRIIRNPNIRIGLWSRTAKLVRKELKHIKILSLKEILHDLWPEIFCTSEKEFEADTQDLFTMKRTLDEEGKCMGQEPPQEAQIEVWGVGGTATGHHYDIHLYDDIINERSVTTATQIDKVLEWWEMMQAIKELSAIEKIIGTRYHSQDIYGHILDEEMFEKKNIVIRAAIEDNKPIYRFFTLKDLKRLEKRMGDYSFATQMMNDTVPKGRKIFMPPYDIYITPPEKRKVYITVDPAATTNTHSDHTGLAVSCVDANNPRNVYFLEVNQYKEKPDIIAQIMARKIAQYDPIQALGIELGQQQGLEYLFKLALKDEERRLGKQIHFIFKELPIGKITKADKFDRTIGSMIRQHRAMFLPSMKPLFRQFDLYNPFSVKNDDDMIDSCAMAIQTIEYFSPAHWQNVSISSPVGNPYGQTLEEYCASRRNAARGKSGDWGYYVAS